MNYMIWIIVGVVVILMAIIGYFADKKTKPAKVKKQNIPEVNVAKIEASEGAATWSKDAKPKDERQEKEHKVASIDDWSKIPETNEEPKPASEEPPANDQEPMSMFENPGSNQSEIKEIATENISVPATEPMQIPEEPSASAENNETPVVENSGSNQPEIKEIATENISAPATEPNIVQDEPSVPTPTIETTEPSPEPASINEITPANAQPVEQASIPEQITEPVSTENIWN